MRLRVAIDREVDGRWIGEIHSIPGALAYGRTRAAALSAVQVLALRIIADRLENGDAPACPRTITFDPSA